jgi:hypothetical protein
MLVSVLIKATLLEECSVVSFFCGQKERNPMQRIFIFKCFIFTVECVWSGSQLGREILWRMFESCKFFLWMICFNTIIQPASHFLGGLFLGGLISVWLYKENKLRDWKNVFTLSIPHWAPRTFDFVVLNSITHTTCRSVAQAVSRWLPTAATWFQNRV